MKRSGTSLLGAGLFVLVLALIGGIVYKINRHWIEAGEVGLIYDASSGLQNKVYEPQALLVGWRQSLYTYPTKPQNAVYTQDATDGEVRAADGILITTSDNANTTFDVSVVFRVKKENVIQVFKTFGPIDIHQIQSQHIRRAIKEGASEIGTKYTVFELMGTKREEASEKLTQELKDRLGPKGITIEHAMLLKAYPNTDTTSRINSSINSFTQIGIATLENQIAQITSQSEVVRAEAAQKARTLTASKTQAKSLTMLNLELEQEAIKKWNGHLSPIQPQSGQTIVLGGNGIIPSAQGGK